MSPTIRSASAVAFGVVAVVLLIISTVGYRTAQRSAEANRSVAHTYQVLNALEHVWRTTMDAETGVRGFVITGARQYLEPFNRADEEFRSRIDAVAVLTADNPVQRRHVAELRSQTRAAMQVLEQMVSLAEKDQAILPDLSDREQRSMDAVRATLQRMRTDQQQLMVQRNQDASSADVRTRALMTVLIAAAFGVLALSFLFVDRGAVQLGRLNESLSERVRDRTVQLEQALANEQDARQHAEHAEQRFKQVVDAAPTAMVAVDSHGTVVLVNALAERLFGYPRGDLVGHSVERLVPERFRAGHARFRTDFSAAPTMRQMGAGRDLYGARKDGSEVSIEIGLSPIELDGDTLVLASIADITERKRLEAEREQARAEADAANRSKDVFLARVSHELRTPLNALTGWARMVHDGHLPPERTAHAIAAIDRNGELLKTLVEDLIDMSRVTTGALQLNRQHVDVTALAQESLTLVEPAASAKGVEIRTEIESRPIVVDGDPTRLRQVMWNLLSNAIKFTPARGHVMFSVHPMDHEVEIRVADDGQGITSDFLPRVFEPFSQVDHAGGLGLGLGLAIVQQLVNAHGGRVDAMSGGIGAGTTFTVRFPIVQISERV